MATAEELRRWREDTSLFSRLFDYVRENEAALAAEGRRPVLGGLLSKEPVMGVDTIRYEGIRPMIAGLLDPVARGFDAPRAAAEGLIPAEDMTGEAFGTAGSAMLGGGAVVKPAGSLGMNVLRDTPNEMRGNQVLVRIPVKDVEHGESAMPGGKLTWPDAPRLIEEYAQKDTDLPPIEIMADEGGMAMIADGSHRFEAAKLRGQDYVEAYVDDDDLAELPSAQIVNSANASKSAGLLGVASDVADRGDTVLSMLKSGRGSDVTDDMLNMGDSVKNTQLNQYLFENYDLPMDEASRMARAREMGFEGGLLHGTGSDIAAVDPAKLGEKQNVLGKGFYQTTNPERAERYVPRVTDEEGNRVFAEGGNVMPLMTKSADEFDLTDYTGKENISRIASAFDGSGFDVELRDGGDSAFIRSKTDPKMSVFLDSKQEGQATLMRLKDAFGNNNITPILQGAGFTGVKGVESRGSNVRVNYNPEDVRSQFARFDPRLSHLSNVTAANMSPLGGLLAQSGVSDDQAQRIEDYLYKTGLLQ